MSEFAGIIGVGLIGTAGMLFLLFLIIGIQSGQSILSFDPAAIVTLILVLSANILALASYFRKHPKESTIT